MVAEVTAPVHSVAYIVFAGGIEPGAQGSYTRMVGPFEAELVVDRLGGAEAVQSLPPINLANVNRSDTRTVLKSVTGPS
jgi:hypothetical protein